MGKIILKGKLKAWGTTTSKNSGSSAVIEFEGKGEHTLPWGTEIELSYEKRQL